MEAYEDATSTVHGYLVINCDPTSPQDLKLRTHIFPGEQTVWKYLHIWFVGMVRSQAYNGDYNLNPYHY